MATHEVTTMFIVLTQEQLDLLEKPINGEGGKQSLLRSLAKTRTGNVQYLDASQRERVVRYSYKYGEGGFQERIRPLARILLAA